MGSKCLLCSNLLEFQNVLCGRHCYHYYLYFIDGETEAQNNYTTCTDHRVYHSQVIELVSSRAWSSCLK